MIDLDELIADTKSAMDDRENNDRTGWFWVGRLLDALVSVRAERDAEVAAKAWDEGQKAGEENAGIGMASLLTGLPAPKPVENPHRRDQGDE